MGKGLWPGWRWVSCTMDRAGYVLRHVRLGLSWRNGLRLLALAIAVGGAGFWWAGGAHWGWTKTSVPVRTLDEVTGLEAITYRPQFVPGVDFLVAVWITAGLVAGASLLFRRDARVALKSEAN